MHYSPKDSEIFMINVQISRFFKELCEFESELTPEFRHPFIQNKIVQNISSISDQNNPIKNNTSCVNQKIKVNVSFTQITNKLYPFKDKNPFNKIYKDYPDIFKESELKSNLYLKKKIRANEHIITDYLEKIGILHELESLGICGINQNFIKQHESLNIDIPLNKNRFLDYFIRRIKKKNSREEQERGNNEYEFDVLTDVDVNK